MEVQIVLTVGKGSRIEYVEWIGGDRSWLTYVDALKMWWLNGTLGKGQGRARTQTTRLLF